ncbi:hypothetical protein [Vibrio sp. D431a]|uniref:hypothetical protein n=1 Tax=Vibrio sp. D431a TaxID=2837388 RepID=UPI00255344AA|nr:hypothetical protein [Vibrio sp. D431a]MDK9793751.1 hypothetical protein [Vibrio sp. D431a]
MERPTPKRFFDSLTLNCFSGLINIPMLFGVLFLAGYGSDFASLLTTSVLTALSISSFVMNEILHRAMLRESTEDTEESLLIALYMYDVETFLFIIAVFVGIIAISLTDSFCNDLSNLDLGVTSGVVALGFLSQVFARQKSNTLTP